jgi:hypothetical protein
MAGVKVTKIMVVPAVGQWIHGEGIRLVRCRREQTKAMSPLFRGHEHWSEEAEAKCELLVCPGLALDHHHLPVKHNVSRQIIVLSSRK